MTAPQRITSQSYTAPYRPRLIAAYNGVGKALAGVGAASTRIDVDSLISSAARKSGLSDFGDPSFRDRLGLLATAIESEARLHPFGLMVARQNIIRFLVNRLRIEEAFKAHPEILELPMEDPVFVVGLQRTGTTMLHRLLAADTDHFRFLASWEAINPAPFPGKKAAAVDPRTRMAVMSQNALKYIAPDFFAIHPIDAFGPEEDCLLFDYDFWSTVPEATMRVPSFSRWLESQDHTPSYRYFKNILRYLYWQNPRGRWVLKTPQHMEHFDELLAVFPNAKIIHTHRDPVKVIPSFCSMVSHAYGVFSDKVDPAEIGAHWSRKAMKMTNHSMAARDANPADRFHDVQYADLTRDPVAAVRSIYGFLGLPFTDTSRQRVLDWRSENSQHKYGKHVYKPEDFGLGRGSIMDSFEPYRSRFNIPQEKEHA